MSFYKRYELDRLIADGDAKTFRAIENATGRAVLLHMFNPQGQAVLGVLKSKLARDPARPTPPLLELGEFAGSPYAVTEDVVGFKDVRNWLAQLPESLAAMPPMPPPAPRASPSQGGSTTERFNRLFDDSPVRQVSPLPSTPPLARPASNSSNASSTPGEFTREFGGPTPVRQPPVAPAPEPSEFTRMFGGQSPSTPAPAPPHPPPPAPRAQTVAGPGEFTQVFKLQPSAPSAPPPPPNTRGDEFDRMFGPIPGSQQAPVAQQVESRDRSQFTGTFGMGPVGESINIEEEARAARSAAPGARPFQAPSEFTRVFGREADSKRQEPVAGPKTIGSASGLFGDPKSPSGQPLERAQTGPGEYTRIIAAQKKPDAGAPSNPMPAAAAKKRNWVLWVAIGVPLLLLIVFAIVALVRSRA